MNIKNKKIALLFGGVSQEHEISILSAKSVHAALKELETSITSICIDKKGKWWLLDAQEATEYLWDHNEDSLFAIEYYLNKMKRASQIAFMPSMDLPGLYVYNHGEYRHLDIDLMFPILHGTYGEDGKIQGLLEVLGIDYIGCNTATSSICMDKFFCKTLVADANIAVAHHVILNQRSCNELSLQDKQKIEKLSFPLIVKPVNQGSSVGISKVNSMDRLQNAVDIAFNYDNKVLIEQYIVGREIECAILQRNHSLEASHCVGEIVTHNKGDFYSYHIKYIEPSLCKLILPAEVTSEKLKEIQEKAIRIAKVLQLRDLARIDFFLSTTGELIFNEVNTMPGFTNISMYPKLWKASGLSMPQLLQTFIENHSQ